jgi:Uma2 family endonuclease
MSVSERTFELLALEDPEGHWELHCGHLRRKPGMTVEHNRVAFWLAVALADQLDRNAFDVRANMGHVRRPPDNYYIPDVCVIPMEMVRPLFGRRGLEAYAAPLPLVVEVWSASTGDYDVETKLLEYQRRGDLEIWRIHPYERTLTVWRRQPDGSYIEAQYSGGTVQPIALPNVTIDLDRLFD